MLLNNGHVSWELRVSLKKASYFLEVVALEK